MPVISILGNIATGRRQKKMKKKDERIADLELKRRGINPRIYHFETRVKPFTAITIAVEFLSWTSLRAALDDIIMKTLPFLPHEKATQLREALARRGIHGVSICDPRDEFNRQRGRTIAKGRLLEHLKQEEVKNGK